MGDFYTNAVRHPEDTGVGNIRRVITLADFQGNSNLVPIGTLESGAYPDYVNATVLTAFNSGTSDAIDIGTSGTPAGFAAAAATLAQATGFKGNLSGSLTGTPLASDTTVYAKLTSVGTAATTGKIAVVMKFENKRETVGTPWPQN